MSRHIPSDGSAPIIKTEYLLLTMTESLESLTYSGKVDLPYPQNQKQRNTRLMAKSMLLVAGAVLMVITLIGKEKTDTPITVPSIRMGDDAMMLESAEPTSISDDLYISHDEQWSEIQETLCPVGLPETSFGPTLFALARKELGITLQDFMDAKKKQHTSHQKDDDALTYRFFHGHFSTAVVYTKSDNSSFTYIPIWKSANDAIRRWIRGITTEQTTVEHIPMSDLFKNASHKPRCVVTAIRDPVSHFLSGYNEIEFRRDTLANSKILPHYYRMSHDTKEQRHRRFVQFVKDFALEDSQALPHEPFGHVFSMSRILNDLDHVGGYLTGYLPSISNLSSDFPIFVRDTCHFDEDLPPVKDNMGKHISSDDPDGFYEAAKSVWAERGEAARALCMLHALDYACWRDLPNGVPVVCQEVYSSPEFVASIRK